jgi:hypothetical protein
VWKGVRVSKEKLKKEKIPGCDWVSGAAGGLVESAEGRGLEGVVGVLAVWL